jgi:polyisoprenoid-binding protein YceI
MTSAHLQERLAETPPPRLLHVLPEEVFAAERIPGSLNACIYETAFGEKIGALLPHKSAPVVVYGAGSGSREADVAAEALRGAGYSDVAVCAGGLEAWRAAGLPLEGDGSLPAATPPADGRYLVDTSASVVRWTGRNLFNHHSGTVGLAGGELEVRAGALATAAFFVAMDTIACEDITDTALNRMLIAHLKNADFFDVASYPVATFTVSSCAALPGAPEGRENFRLGGALNVRGVTRSIEFPAVIAADGEGRLTGQACLDIDRTEFGSIYGSGRFFRFLGKHVVNDVVHLHLRIHAVRRDA